MVADRRAGRRRRRLRVLGGVAVIAAVVGASLGLARLRSGSGHPPSPALNAAPVPGAEGPLAMADTPAGYHAVYRAESYQGAKVTRTTEDISVRRPFDGRVSIREGTTPAGALQFEGRSTLGSYANYTESGPSQVSGDAPGVAFGDLRLGSSLDDLVANGLFLPRERRQALGQECQVYRTGSPLQSQKVTAPTATDYADTCLNAAGLPLEEVTVVGGKLTQRLTATELVADPAFEPDTFTIQGDPVSFGQGGSVLTPVDPAASPPPGFWQLDGPPAGFEHQGRYVLQTVDQAAPDSGQPVSSYVDAYVRGADVLVVRQGPVAGEPDLTPAPPDGDPFDLGPLGPAQVHLSSVGPTVAARPGTDTYVDVSGTLSPAELRGVAAGLRQG
jgi:hypothetical protein